MLLSGMANRWEGWFSGSIKAVERLLHQSNYTTDGVSSFSIVPAGAGC
jgi:hypothetical protein